MDFKMSKFDIDRIACLMYRDIAAYIKKLRNSYINTAYMMKK